MTKTFYWHDYETFGAVPKYDRPAQFAGIRTDLDFNIIGEPLNIYCQPPRDQLPHPEACLLTGITPQLADREGVPEPQFIQQVVHELSEPNTIALGYNNLRFDDEITRHTLFRNFFDPYEREWKNGCGRWDLIDLTRAAYALRPDGINWPQREDGATSFKLEALATANGLDQTQAHDALSDVYATIGLAKLIKTQQPRLFDFVFNNRSKAAVQNLLDIDKKTPVVHISSKFPANQGCLSLMMPLMPHPHISTQIIGYDLRHDPKALLELDAHDLRDRLFTPTVDLPEGIERVHLKGIYTNRCPVLAPVNTLDEATIQRCQLDMPACRQHWKWLNDHFEQLAPTIVQAYAEHEFAGVNDPEQGLYDGFISNEDKALATQVRQMSSQTLAEMSDNGHPAFQDARLTEILFRYRARFHPDSMNDIERDEYQQWRSNRIQFAPDGGLSLSEYQQLLEQLKPQLANNPDQLLIITQLEEWGRELTTSI